MNLNNPFFKRPENTDNDGVVRHTDIQARETRERHARDTRETQRRKMEDDDSCGKSCGIAVLFALILGAVIKICQCLCG